MLRNSLMRSKTNKLINESRIVSAAAEDMLIGQKYNSEAVHRAFSAGLKELTGENRLENAWSSLFSAEFNDMTIEDEEKSCFSEMVTKDITKLLEFYPDARHQIKYKIQISKSK